MSLKKRELDEIIGSDGKPFNNIVRILIMKGRFSWTDFTRRASITLPAGYNRADEMERIRFEHICT